VQRLAWKVRSRCECHFLRCGFRSRRLARLAIGRVADKRMADMRQMHANLVGASGFKTALYQTGEWPLGIAKFFDQTISSTSDLAAATKYRHAFAVKWVATNRSLDGAVAYSRCAPDDGMVGALDGVVGKLLGKAPHSALALGGHEKTARILIEAMNDAWPGHPADA